MQFVAEYGAATGLQNDHRSIFRYVGTKRAQVAVQIRLRHIEKTVIIERPAAAKMLIQHFNLATRMFEYFYRGSRCFRHEVIVESVRPEKHLRSSRRVRLAVLKPRLECLSGECRNLSLPGHTYRHLGRVAQAGQLRE